MAGLKSLLYSRKFWLAVWVLIQTIILHYFAVPYDIIAALAAVVAVLIGAIAAEDAAAKLNGSQSPPQ